MPYRVCLGCGQLTRNGSRCTGCQLRKGSTREWRKTRARILKASPTCAYCGEPATEIDHLVPVAKGGTDHLDNLVSACRSCNRSKGSR